MQNMTRHASTSNDNVLDCDLLVVGSGGAALAAAVTGTRSGLKVIVVEKDMTFGGTTATSGGMLWIPGNTHSAELQAQLGESDDLECARNYIVELAGNYADRARIDSFLQYGPEMVDFLERESHVRFMAAEHPDYDMGHPAARRCRSLASVEYKADVLGPHFRSLKSELPQMLFMGFAIGSAVEMKQFFQAGRSPVAFLAVISKITRHLLDTAIHGAPRRVVRGRALITRLAQTLFENHVPIMINSPAKELIVEAGAVCGAIISTPEGDKTIRASRGVVLACGGFPHNAARRQRAYPANAYDGVARSVASPGNTGDAADMAEKVGGIFSADVSNAAAWMPTSVIPSEQGVAAIWPHLVDRLKAGFIAITAKGKRFGNESSAYSRMVPQLLEATREDPFAFAWLIGDKRAVDRWGIGRVRPAPMPRRGFIRSGYLVEAPTIEALAQAINVDPVTLSATIARFNDDAREGVDTEFGRGGNAYDHYQGDEEHQPNPCLAPLAEGPFYAVKIFAGEIGTFAGIRTDKFARVVDAENQPIRGLYAVGNDQLSVFGGAYPGAGSTLGPGLTFGYVAARHAAGLIE